MRGITLLTFLLATSAGCSRVKVAYTWLDWVLERQAHQYLDLTRDQSDAAEKAIDAYLVWHRSTILPQYARFLHGTAGALRAGPMDEAQFAGWYDRLHRLYEQTMAGAIEVMADLLCDQSSGQITHLEEALAHRQEEVAESTRGPERLDDLVGQYEDGFEDLFGDLRDDQKADLADRVRWMHREPEPWLAERVRRDRVLVAMLRHGAGRDQVVHTLRLWWLGRPDPGMPPDYEPYRREFTANMEGLVFAMLASLDTKQRTDLARRLDEFARDFEDLAATT
jgi:hypothetical protein